MIILMQKRVIVMMTGRAYTGTDAGNEDEKRKLTTICQHAGALTTRCRE